MASIPLVLICCVSIAVAGCSSLAVSSDYDATADFSQLSTYGWLPDQDRGGRYFLALKNAIDAKFVERGYSRAGGSSPDFWVAIHTSSQETLEVKTRDYGDWHGRQLQATRVDQYLEGTVIIDIIDPESSQLTWSGWASGAVREGEDVRSRIDEAVDQILKRFPPGDR